MLRQQTRIQKNANEVLKIGKKQEESNDNE